MRIVLLVAVVASISSCSSGLNRPIQEVTATTGPDQIQHVRIVTHSYWFEPNRVVVKSGVPVELKIKNGAFFVPHNFTCNAPEAGIVVHANVGMFGGSKTVRFTPSQPGEYPFRCHVGSHSKKGMSGTLVVSS